MMCHQRHQRAGGYILLGETIRKVGNPQPGYRGSDEGRSVVGFEASVRTAVMIWLPSTNCQAPVRCMRAERTASSSGVSSAPRSLI